MVDAPRHTLPKTGRHERPRKQRKPRVTLLASLTSTFVLSCGASLTIINAANEAAHHHRSAPDLIAPPTASWTPRPRTTGRTPTAVAFSVTADSGSASVTYGINDDTQQDTQATLPWTQTVKPRPGTEVTYASVIAQNGAGGTIRCAIILDGTVVKQSTSQGSYAVVTCNWSPVSG